MASSSAASSCSSRVRVSGDGGCSGGACSCRGAARGAADVLGTGAASSLADCGVGMDAGTLLGSVGILFETGIDRSSSEALVLLSKKATPFARICMMIYHFDAVVNPLSEQSRTAFLSAATVGSKFPRV